MRSTRCATAGSCALTSSATVPRPSKPWGCGSRGLHGEPFSSRGAARPSSGSAVRRGHPPTGLAAAPGPAFLHLLVNTPAPVAQVEEEERIEHVKVVVLVGD